MSASQDSLHRHWKKAPPNTHAMGLIRQVLYDLDLDEDDNDGMLDIYEVNTLKPKDEARTHWRRFPAAYLPFLKRFFYRFELYLDIHDIVHGSHNDPPFDKDSVRCLKQYIRYMDNVMMEAWEQCRVAAIAQELSPDWRCPALDRWLSLEFHVKRHDVRDVQLYKVKNSGSGLNEDPFELGMLDVYSHVPLFYFICICATDWIEYETSVPDWHHGGGYDYQIMEISDEDLRGIITKVMRWLEYLPDTSDEDDEEDVGNKGKTVTVQEEDISDEEDTASDEEEVIVKVEGKLFLTHLFEVVDHVEIS
jgi:hypothetical protein